MKGSIKMTNIKPGIITEKELVELFGSQSQKKFIIKNEFMKH